LMLRAVISHTDYSAQTACLIATDSTERLCTTLGYQAYSAYCQSYAIVLVLELLLNTTSAYFTSRTSELHRSIHLLKRNRDWLPRPYSCRWVAKVYYAISNVLQLLFSFLAAFIHDFRLSRAQSQPSVEIILWLSIYRHMLRMENFRLAPQVEGVLDMTEKGMWCVCGDFRSSITTI